MPPFAGALTDAELADLVVYIRANSGYPPWTDVPGAVREATKPRE
jgi:mono/diheme cytochrome c family protein